MKDYEMTLESIEYYKDKACKYISGRCDKCEAMHEYNEKQHCQFDTVIRFIKWDNQYNTHRKWSELDE